MHTGIQVYMCLWPHSRLVCCLIALVLDLGPPSRFEPDVGCSRRPKGDLVAVSLPVDIRNSQGLPVSTARPAARALSHVPYFIHVECYVGFGDVVKSCLQIDSWSSGQHRLPSAFLRESTDMRVYRQQGSFMRHNLCRISVEYACRSQVGQPDSVRCEWLQDLKSTPPRSSGTGRSKLHLP